MSKFEINGIFKFKGAHYTHIMPYGFNLKDRLWWRFIPGVVINVKWPKGQVKVGPSHREGWSGVGEQFEYIDSADPNDHYRPWMECHVGRQGWDWDWSMTGNDVAANQLTVKFRKGKEHYATLAMLRWT